MKFNNIKFFVTGGAGFIGSNLVDRLLQEGYTMIAYDNFSTGQERFLEQASLSPNFKLMRGDTLNMDFLTQAMVVTEFVSYLAANDDVRFGTEHPRKDLEENTIATFNVLEAIRANDICQIAFGFTGSIYMKSGYDYHS